MASTDSRRSKKDFKSGKITKSLLKSKLKQKSKHTKAQIQKLDRDLQHISDIHQELAKDATAKKSVKTLDAGDLRADLHKDEISQIESKRAEEDLQSQLETLTGMSLDKV